MPDKPLRLYGPLSVYLANAQTLYTTPSQPPTTTFIRDITFANTTSSNIQMRMGINSLTNVENRVFDFTVPASDTYSFRGLWILTSGDTILAQQITTTGTAPTNVTSSQSTTDATSFTTAAWVPAAATLYFLTCQNTKTEAPDVVSTITGNGTWTSLATVTTGSVAATIDDRLSMFYWYSSAAGSSATTTVNFGGVTQLSFNWSIDGYTNLFFGDYTSTTYPTLPVIQSATNNDSALPGASTAGLATTLGASLTGGIVYAAQGRVAVTGVTASSTPPSGFTELSDAGNIEGHFTTYGRVDATSSTQAANTWSTSLNALRTSISAELATTNVVNVMINGIEVS